MVEGLVVFKQRFRNTMPVALFAHEHFAAAREYQRGHVVQAVGTKADGGLEQTAESSRLEKLDSSGFIHRRQFLAEHVQLRFKHIVPLSPLWLHISGKAIADTLGPRCRIEQGTRALAAAKKSGSTGPRPAG